jgi:CRISPR-associated protein Cas1
MLEARGLDPAMGLYHEPRAGRDSLALDLLEEFRQPVVDRFVLRAANLRIFSPDDFEPDDRAGVRMTSPALKRFFRQWEEHLAKPLQGPEGQRLAVRPWIHRQVESLARALRTGEAYQPFLWRDS